MQEFVTSESQSIAFDAMFETQLKMRYIQKFITFKTASIAFDAMFETHIREELLILCVA